MVLEREDPVLVHAWCERDDWSYSAQAKEGEDAPADRVRFEFERHAAGL